MNTEVQECACSECLAGFEPCECSRCEYLAENLEFHRPIERVALNGERVTLGEDERYTDSLGRFGYWAHLGGSYVCYTCGHLCECGELEE